MRKVKYPEMGSRIRQARIDAGLKQKDCLLPLGDITAQMLSDWENGYVCPTITYLRNIANFYKVSLDYIILGKKKDQNDKTIRTYKDVAECFVDLLGTGIFEIRDSYIDHGAYQTYLLTYDKTLHNFKEELDNLLVARKSMKKELFDEAVKDLIDKYDITIKTSK
ncbi:MAG: helix-turn-helix domain-containing protein [Clostridia bacterium]|nr:helix-turn-helix domain-containing protein [Clostridia bacterium]